MEKSTSSLPWYALVLSVVFLSPFRWKKCYWTLRRGTVSSLASSSQYFLCGPPPPSRKSKHCPIFPRKITKPHWTSAARITLRNANWGTPPFSALQHCQIPPFAQFLLSCPRFHDPPQQRAFRCFFFQCCFSKGDGSEGLKKPVPCVSTHYTAGPPPSSSGSTSRVMCRTTYRALWGWRELRQQRGGREVQGRPYPTHTTDARGDPSVRLRRSCRYTLASAQRGGKGNARIERKRLSGRGGTFFFPAR